MSSAVIPLPTSLKTPRSHGLSLYAAAVLGFMVLVILWGAIVRATGSGAGCGSNWPLCNGDFFPHHPRLATIIEFTHRSMSGVCVALIAGLIAWTFWAKPRGHRARNAVIFCGVLLITEALLGAVLVLGGYVEHNASDMRVFMQCIHFTNTMLLLAALTVSWWWLRPRAELKSLPPSTRPIAWLALASTIVVGATGSVAALADTLFPAKSWSTALLEDFAAHSPLLIRMRWLHPGAAVVHLICVILLAMNLRGTTARTLLFLIVAQFILGIADVLLVAPTWMQVLHLLGADFYWIALVAVCTTVLEPQTRAPNFITAAG